MFDTGLAQPELSGGAFGASLQGPGREVEGGDRPHVVPVHWDHVCKHCLTGGTVRLTVWDMWTDISVLSLTHSDSLDADSY